MSKFGVCSISLGYTRLAGLLVYDTRTKDFTETKPKAARDMISNKSIFGVLWNEKMEQFVPDPSFNRSDILVKSGVGNYRKLLKEVPGEKAGSDYLLVRVLKTNKGDLYELVNNKCQRVKLTETQIRGLYAIGTIGGMIINEDETITICNGVVIENRVYPDEVVLDLTPVIDNEAEADKTSDADSSESGLSGDASETGAETSDTNAENESSGEDNFMKVPEDTENNEKTEPQSLQDLFKDAEMPENTEEPASSESGDQNKSNKSKGKRRK